MNHNELNIEEIVTELLNNLAERDNLNEDDVLKNLFLSWFFRNKFI